MVKLAAECSARMGFENASSAMTVIRKLADAHGEKHTVVMTLMQSLAELIKKDSARFLDVYLLSI